MTDETFVYSHGYYPIVRFSLGLMAWHTTFSAQNLYTVPAGVPGLGVVMEKLAVEIAIGQLGESKFCGSIIV